jgi:hypothetical protein
MNVSFSLSSENYHPIPMASISQISFLKQVVTIMMGLSLTSCVKTFITQYVIKTNATYPEQWESSLIFILILLNIIRFFYGNWMYLETEFSAPHGFQSKNNLAFNRRKYLLSFIIIITQSIIFSALSLKTYDRFFYFFCVALVVDAVGFTLLSFFDKNTNLPVERSWIWNNALAVIALLTVFLLVREETFYWCFVISALNTFFGFALSWRRFCFSK